MNIEEQNATLDSSLIEAARFLPVSVHPPEAWCGHLPFAWWIVRQLRPRVLVELGTHAGNSYFSFCQSVKEAELDTHCYAVDTWEGDDHAGQYEQDVFELVYHHNQAHYSGFSRLQRMTFDEAAPHFDEGTIDLLHIDGLHTYEAVRHDFENWLPKLAPGAVVIFHDTNVRERDFGVWKLWSELQERYPANLEFAHSNGLGVLQIDDTPEKLLPWLRADEDEKARLKEYFSALGARQLERYELSQLRKLANHFHQGILERDARISDLQQMLGEKDSALNEGGFCLNQRELLLAEKDRAIAELRAQQRDLLQSTSWRVTRPLRAISRAARSMFSSEN